MTRIKNTARKEPERPALASERARLYKIADELESTYAMSPSERRTHEHLLRAMRAANREFCSHLRRALPINRTKHDIANFLTQVEQQCKEAERHDSDEFV